MAEASKEAVWIQSILTEFGIAHLKPAQMFVDNQSAIKLSMNPEIHKRSKHIDVKYHYTRQLVENKTIEVHYVPKAAQIADILTKPLLKTKHKDMVKMVGLVEQPPQNKKQKSQCAVTPKLFTVMAFMLSVLMPGIDSISHQQPVIWRTSATPITNGHNEVHLMVKFINPCKLLRKSTVHRDLLPTALEKCNAAYQEMYIDPLDAMCPRLARTVVHHRVKRFIVTFSIFIATIVVSTVVAGGIGTAALVTSVQNSNSVSELESKLAEQKQRVDQEAKKLRIAEDAINRLNTELYTIAKSQQRHEKDYNELKHKSVESSFSISYIISRLVYGNWVFKQADREWKRKRVHPPFLDLFNITLPCGMDCPVNHATAQKCWMSDDHTKLHLDFIVPVQNNTLYLVEADPFLLHYQTEDKTCSMEYTGPKTAIVSKDNDCVYAVNVRKSDIIISRFHKCTRESRLPDSSKYFTLQKCEKRQQNDSWNFVQVKLFDAHYYIYCAGNNFTIGSRTPACKNETFIIPVGTNFAFNEHYFKAGENRINHHEILDPSISHRANWHLQPHLDIDDIVNEIEKNPVLQDENLKDSTRVHHWQIANGAILLLVLIGIVVLALFICRYRKIKIHPLSGNQGEEELEMTNRVDEANSS